MPDSDPTPQSVELGSDSDDWPSSDQDEVVHSLSKDVKEHFGMLVFAKFAGHPPHPAVIWDPRFSLPRVKKQWYRSTKKDKEYIVKWLGYDAECPMWNKVPERGIEEAKLGSILDEYCKKIPNDTVYQGGCKVVRQALKEGISNKQRWREQRKSGFRDIQQIRQTITSGRKNKKNENLPTQQQPVVSSSHGAKNGKHHKSDLDAVTSNDSDAEEAPRKLRKRNSNNKQQHDNIISQRLSKSIEPEEQEDDDGHNDKTETMVKIPSIKGQHNIAPRRASSSHIGRGTTTTTLPHAAEELTEQAAEVLEKKKNVKDVTTTTTKLKRRRTNSKHITRQRDGRRSSLRGAESTELQMGQEDPYDLASSVSPLKEEPEMAEGNGVQGGGVPVSNDEEEKKKLVDSSNSRSAVVVVQDSQEGEAADAEKPVKKVLSKQNKGCELKFSPDRIDDNTPSCSVALCVERLKAAIDDGSTEAQLEALDKLEKEKFDFEVMKKTRAGKVVSKLVRKSHDAVVGNRAGALERRWRDLLELQGSQEVVMRDEGTTASTMVAAASPSAVSYLKQEPVAASKKQHPPKPPTSTQPPRSMVEDSSSTLRHQQRLPLVVPKPSPKLDAMALLEDVMLPGSSLSPQPFRSPPQSADSSSGVYSSERQAAVPQWRPTTQSGLEATEAIQHLDFVRKRGLMLLTMGLCKSHCNGPNFNPSKVEIQKAKNIESAIFASTSNILGSGVSSQCGNAYRDRVRVVSMLLGNGDKSGRKLYRKVMSGLIIVDDLVRKTPLELLCWVD